MFGPKRKLDDFSEEIKVHLQLEIERLKEQGLSEEEARAAAHRTFGNTTKARERFYESGRWVWGDHLWQDVRYGVRMLRKSPGFTAVAVLTLALGIGANTAIFSVLDSVMLRKLPVVHSEQLVLLTNPDSHGHNFGSEGGDRSLLAYSEFEYLRDHNEVFSSIFASDSELSEVRSTVGGSSNAGASAEESLRVRLVSGDYFQTLGVTPAAGWMFTSEMDKARGGSPFAVASYSFWKRRFNLDPSIIGKTIQVNQTSFEIIGVTQPGFFGETVGEAPDVWIPAMMQDAIYPGRDLLTPSQDMTNIHTWLLVMARLKPGVTTEQAKASINVTFKRMLDSLGSTLNPQERHELEDQWINLQAGARGSSTLHDAYGEPLKVLMGLVGFVLLIACANVANLLLARGTARQKEFAVRLAIGGGRGRLIRQLLSESVLLALAGAAAGIVLAQWADTLLIRMVSRGSTGRETIQVNLRPDARMLAFTLGIAVLSAILFGLIPAIRATRFDLSPILKSTSSRTTGEDGLRRMPAGKVLVIAQVAISLILLVAAGLFVHSLSKLSEVNLGYKPENLLLFQVDGAAGGYKGAANLRFQQELLEKFSAIPGVRAATLSSNGLFSQSESADPISVEGYTPNPGEEMHSRMDHVAPGYFSTVGIPVLIGREIGPQDSGNGPRAAVINKTFAGHFFGNTNPLGKKVRDTYPGNPSEMEIVGVVADAKYNSLREKTPLRLYAPYFNPMWEQSGGIYEIRTAADPASVSAALHKTVQETNSSLPPIRINTMQVLVDDSLHTDKFIARLAGVFSLLAMLLASIGLYGIMAYTVARRTRDLGIRMALGAPRSSVVWLVLRETLLLVLIGVAVGLPVAFGGTHLIKSMLFGLGIVDPVAMIVPAITLAVVAALAGFLPARRAMRLDPMVALRYE
jgi:predicted permease